MIDRVVATLKEVVNITKLKQLDIVAVDYCVCGLVSLCYLLLYYYTIMMSVLVSSVF